MQFVVIPDLTTRKLTTSSVLLGGQVLENAKNKEADPQIQLSVDRRFSRLTRLGYWMFIYNAKRDATGAPSLTAQTQVLRDGQVMMASPQRKLTRAAPTRTESRSAKRWRSRLWRRVVTICGSQLPTALRGPP